MGLGVVVVQRVVVVVQRVVGVLEHKLGSGEHVHMDAIARARAPST